MTIEKLEALERQIDLTNASTLVGVVDSFPHLIAVAKAAKAMVDEAKKSPGGLASMEGVCEALSRLEAQ